MVKVPWPLAANSTFRSMNNISVPLWHTYSLALQTRHVLTGQIHPPPSRNNNPSVMVNNWDFQYVCTVTLTLEIWPWLKVMTHLGSWTTIMWNIIQIQHGNEELWPGHRFSVCMQCDLDLGDMTLGQGHDTTLGHGQWVFEILSQSNIAVRSYGPDTDFGVYALWPWPWRYDLWTRSWHTLGSWTTIVWNIIQIQHGNEEKWPGHGFWVCVHCDLDLGIMTLG